MLSWGLTTRLLRRGRFRDGKPLQNVILEELGITDELPREIATA